IVIVVDDEDRENEGDLIMAAECATPDKIAFFLHHTSGVICAPITRDRAHELDLPLMVSDNTESMRTAFTVSVDARQGTTTRITGASVPTEWGESTCNAYEPARDGSEHQASGRGATQGEDDGLGRVRWECLTGAVFGSLRCDCAPQLPAARQRIAQDGRGAVV